MGSISKTYVTMALYLSSVFSASISSVTVGDNYLSVSVSSWILVMFMTFLNQHSVFRFEELLDVWCVDYPSNAASFEVNYLVWSLLYGRVFIINVSVAELEALESLVGVFPSAGWLEWEVWDLFGVYFCGHKDLSSILTDYGFVGHPLSNDFPLGGFLEVRYDDGENSVLQEPVEFAQEYWVFGFEQPW